MKELVLFLMCFIFMLIIYEVFVVSKAKKNRKTRKKNAEPIEVKYLITRYNLDMKKVNYNQLLQITALVSSFDIAIVVSIALLFDGYIIQLLIALVVAFIVILFSYHLIGVFYRKKGMIKDV